MYNLCKHDHILTQRWLLLFYPGIQYSMLPLLHSILPIQSASSFIFSTNFTRTLERNFSMSFPFKPAINLVNANLNGARDVIWSEHRCSSAVWAPLVIVGCVVRPVPVRATEIACHYSSRVVCQRRTALADTLQASVVSSTVSHEIHRRKCEFQ